MGMLIGVQRAAVAKHTVFAKWVRHHALLTSCRHAGETTGLGEPKPGPYGRNPAYSHDDVDQSKPGDRKGKKDAAQDEPQPSILGMYNNPLGYMLVGMALFGILFQNMRSG